MLHTLTIEDRYRVVAIIADKTAKYPTIGEAQKANLLLKKCLLSDQEKEATEWKIIDTPEGPRESMNPEKVSGVLKEVEISDDEVNLLIDTMKFVHSNAFSVTDAEKFYPLIEKLVNTSLVEGDLTK